MNTKECGKLINEMESANVSFTMMTSTLESGNRGSERGKASIFINVASDIMGHGLMTCGTEKAHYTQVMAQPSTLEVLSMTKNMARVNFI